LKTRQILFFLLISFLFVTSCQTVKSIRSIDQVYKTSTVKNIKDIGRLIPATEVLNRDIAGVAIYELGMYLIYLDTEKPKSLARQLPKEKRIHAEEEIKKLIFTIREQIKKVYYLNADFNIRNICIQAMFRVPEDDTFTFIQEVLAQGDQSSFMTLMKLLQTYPEQLNKHKEILKPGLLSLLSKSTMPLTAEIITTLSFIKNDSSITDALVNYSGITNDSFIKALISSILKGKDT
jgi:hypothetical protein